MSSLRQVVVVGVLLAVSLTPRAAAQSVTGTLSGNVIDEQGRPISGATVTVIREATGEARVTVTDTVGDFQVTNLLPAS